MDKEIKFIGNYKILDVIGKGGMAKVYTAIQMPLNRVVVVKEMSKSSSGEFRKRFRNEALITATLEHPNIVSIYDYFNVGQTSYLVMQYIDGIGLADVIENEAPLRPVIAATIAREICLAISHAHQNNIIHRDIKPSNVLISKQGQLKVTDFGVAKDEAARDLTSVGTLIGTPCYMSPEQASGKKLTAQSDIFAIGIVLYEMFTGKKPFWGESADEITAKISKGKYKSPFLLAPHHSFRLARIISKALKKNLNRRYSTIAQLLHDLERYIGANNVARSQMIMSQLVNSVALKKQSTTLIKKTGTRKKKQSSNKRLFYLYFLLVIFIAAFIFVLIRILLHK